MLLKNLSKNVIITNQVEKATTLWKRLSGLIPFKSMPQDYALWIPASNSIHSFLMGFEFDAVFVDKNMRVKKCVPNVKPNQIIWPVLGARSVFEMNAGLVEKFQIEIGDQLHVVD